MKNIAFQQHLKAEDACELALLSESTHFYVDTSISENKLSNWTEARKKALLDQANGLQIVVHGDGTNPVSHKLPSISQAAVNHSLQEIQLAADLQASYILHGGQIYTTGSMEAMQIESLERFYVSYRSILDAARAVGVEVWVENLANFDSQYPFANVLTSTEAFTALAQRFPDLKIIFDIGHFHVGQGDHAEFVEKLSDHIVAISLSDNDTRRDMHAPLGFGTVPWKTIQRLFPLDWQGLFVFETKSHNPLEDVDFYYEGIEVAA